MKAKIVLALGLAGLLGTVALASARPEEPEVDEQAVKAVIEARLHQLLTERLAARASLTSPNGR